MSCIIDPTTEILGSFAKFLSYGLSHTSSTSQFPCSEAPIYTLLQASMLLTTCSSKYFVAGFISVSNLSELILFVFFLSFLYCVYVILGMISS